MVMMIERHNKTDRELNGYKKFGPVDCIMKTSEHLNTQEINEAGCALSCVCETLLLDGEQLS